jgi:HK97 family phage prohead protease
MAANKTEVRTFRGIALRASQSGDMSIAGRALSYNTPSGNLGGFKEILAPGCFSRSIASGRVVKCLREHQDGFLLGSTRDGSLTLQDSPAGLDFSCKIDPNDPIAVSTRAAIQAGKIDSMSFAFAVDGDDGQEFSGPDNNDGLLTRTVKRALLLDVSPVFSPAYPVGTSVAARAADYVAARPVISDQTVIHAQITAFENLQANKKRQRIADARSQFAEYSPLTAEEIVRCKKLGYSEDLMLELRAAAYAREIGGPTFEAGPMRYSGGSSEDPELKFRDDEGQIWPEAARTTEEHKESVKYHTNCAASAKSLHEAESHYHAADRHAYAAAYPNDTLASDRARQASRIIGHPENSL